MDALRGTFQQQIHRFSAGGGLPLPLIIFAGAALVALAAGFLSPAAGFALLVLGLLAALVAEFVQSQRATSGPVPSARERPVPVETQSTSARAEVEIEDLAGHEQESEAQSRRLAP